MPRQIIRTEQRDIGAQLGQALSGGTSAYFDTLHKGEMRKLETQKVGEVLRHNRASESLSALGVASTIAAENIRGKRMTDIAQSNRRSAEAIQEKGDRAAGERNKLQYETTERIANAKLASDQNIARMKAAGDKWALENDPKNWEINQSITNDINKQFASDVALGEFQVPKVDKNRQFVGGGKWQDLDADYPIERYQEYRFPEQTRYLKRFAEESFRVSDEGRFEFGQQVLGNLKEEKQDVGSLQATRGWVETEGQYMKSLPGGKELVQEVEREMDRHTKQMVNQPVSKPLLQRDESMYPTDPAGPVQPSGASGVLGNIEKAIQSEEHPGSYDIGKVGSGAYDWLLKGLPRNAGGGIDLY